MIATGCRNAIVALVAAALLATTTSAAAAGLPSVVVQLLNAAHTADSTIPSGDAVNNAMPVLGNCFGLFGSENLDGCVNALAAAGGASSAQQADLHSVEAGCADAASESCILAVTTSNAGADILGNLLPGADVIVDILTAIEHKDFWALVTKVGVDVACIAAQMLTGVSVCGVIDAIVDAVGAVVGAIGEFADWLSDELGGSDYMSDLLKQSAANLAAASDNGVKGVLARVGGAQGTQPRVDADTYVESLKTQVFGQQMMDMMSLESVYGEVTTTWNKIKPPMVGLINQTWVLVITDASKDAKLPQGLGLAGRSAAILALQNQIQAAGANGDTQKLLDGDKVATTCTSRMARFGHIDDYLALKPPPGPVLQVQTSAQACAGLQKDVAAARAALAAAAGAAAAKVKADDASKLAAKNCTVKGDTWTCATWAGYALCKSFAPVFTCGVDRAAADTALAKEALADANQQAPSHPCALQGLHVVCPRDAANTVCNNIVAAETHGEATQVTCSVQYDAAYAKLVAEVKAVGAMINSGDARAFVAAPPKQQVAGATAILAPGSAAKTPADVIKAMCGGRSNCVAGSGTDPLILVHHVDTNTIGAMRELPATVVVPYEPGKDMAGGCADVSGTAHEIPSLCFMLPGKTLAKAPPPTDLAGTKAGIVAPATVVTGSGARGTTGMLGGVGAGSGALLGGTKGGPAPMPVPSPAGVGASGRLMGGTAGPALQTGAGVQGIRTTTPQPAAVGAAAAGELAGSRLAPAAAATPLSAKPPAAPTPHPPAPAAPAAHPAAPAAPAPHPPAPAAPAPRPSATAAPVMHPAAPATPVTHPPALPAPQVASASTPHPTVIAGCTPDARDAHHYVCAGRQAFDKCLAERGLHPQLALNCALRP